METKTQNCITCLGTGKAMTVFKTETPCPTCKGTGKVTIATDTNKGEE